MKRTSTLSGAVARRVMGVTRSPFFFFAAVDAAGNEKCLGRKGGGRNSVWAGKAEAGIVFGQER